MWGNVGGTHIPTRVEDTILGGLITLAGLDQRRLRLVRIIDDFLAGCPYDVECKNPAEHLAQELLSRAWMWV